MDNIDGYKLIQIAENAKLGKQYDVFDNKGNYLAVICTNKSWILVRKHSVDSIDTTQIPQAYLTTENELPTYIRECVGKIKDHYSKL